MLAATRLESASVPVAAPLALPQIVPPTAALGSVVEAILDWEVADGDVANSLTARLLPCSSPQLCVHYRASAWSNRRRSAGFYRQIASGIQTEVAAIRASGPLGVVAVRLKPEGASRITGVTLRELTDSSVGMRDLFGNAAVALLEEQLAEAQSSLERVFRIEDFLLQRLRADPLSPAMSFAARALRADPTLPARVLAAHLDISERHLSRSFRGIFGTSPKQFARVARVSKILRARWQGDTWTDIAHGMGFFDQAHMINDFRGLVGLSPSQFFGDACGRTAALNASFGRSPFSNVLVTCDRGSRDRPARRLAPGAVDCRHGAENR
jgi:AraC-like DNA-binding protein